MPDPRTSTVAHAYLQELRAAIADLPDEVRDGILTGISEELEGLDPVQASQRIQELGDPQFIAAEARAAADVSPNAESTPLRDSRWYEIVAGLVVMVGGLIIPVIGIVAGLVLVWFSRVWTRADKWIATLIPIGVLVVVFGGGAVASALPVPAQPAPSDDIRNPLIPAFFDVAWMSVILLAVVQVGVGVWLLVRARTTTERR